MRHHHENRFRGTDDPRDRSARFRRPESRGFGDEDSPRGSAAHGGHHGFGAGDPRPDLAGGRPDHGPGPDGAPDHAMPSPFDGGPRFGGGPRGGQERHHGRDGRRDPEGWDDDHRRGPQGWGPVGAGFGPGFPGPRGPRGRRGRAPRGDVRTAVLLLLADEPMHGYQLMQTIAQRTGGRWAPSPGAIYPTLSQLEDEGLIETSKEGGRKLAGLTDEGRAHVDEHRSTWADPFPPAPTDDDEAVVDPRRLLQELSRPLRDIAHSGSDAQAQAAARILREAKKSLYRVLADDDAEAPRD